MTEGPEKSAAELFAWEAAYQSNELYDALQAAKATQEQYEKVGSIGLTGVTVTIEKSVVEEVAASVEAAQRDFDLVKGMVNAVAMAEGSPFAVRAGEASQSQQEPARPPRRRRRRGSQAGGQKNQEGKTSSSMQERMDSILVCLINNDGRVEKTDEKTASTIIIETTKLTKDSWSFPRKKLEASGLIDLEKSTPKAKAFTAVTINEEKLLKLVDDGGASPTVVAAFERYQKRQAEAGDQSGSGGASGFLADRGGAEKAGPSGALPDEQPDELDGQDADETSTELPEDEEAASADDGVIEELALEEDGLQDELSSIRIRSQASSGKRTPISKILDKSFTIGFEVEGRSLRRTIKVRELKNLPTAVRMLIGIGQVNAPTFNFYKTDEERRGYVLRIINKGIEDESKQTDEAGLDQLIAQALTDGHVHMNGKGAELTGAGIDFVRETKYGRAKLGQVMSGRKGQQAEAPQKAGTPASEAALSKAQHVA